MRAWMALGLLLLSPVVAAQSFDSGNIQPGQSWSMTFDVENEDGFHYHCHPHPWMTGMVHVGADTDGEVTTHTVEIVEGETQDDWGYKAQHKFIEVGDTVTWINMGTVLHTVTAGDVTGGGDHDHSDHSHGDDGGHSHGEDGAKDSPAASWLVVGLGMLALAARGKRQN